MEQECLKSVSEHRQRDVRCTKFSKKTVPHSRSLDSEAAVAVVCSGAWKSIGRSERIDDAGCSLLTSARNTSLKVHVLS